VREKLCGHVGGGSIFVGCCSVIDSSPAWFILKIKIIHRPCNGECRPTR